MPPQDSTDLRRPIPRALLWIMPGIGHFSMSEARESFLNHLLPMLQQTEILESQK